MAATVQITYTNGASTGTDNNAETGVTFGRDDSQVSTTPVPKPTAAGTNRSWYKMFTTKVTAGGGTTSLLNRKVRLASAPATGITAWFLTTAPSAYTQATSGNAPADDATTNDTTPASYTALSTTFQTYDSATVAAANSTRNGKFAQIAAGLSNLFSLGAGSQSMPNLEFSYDEQ